MIQTGLVCCCLSIFLCLFCFQLTTDELTWSVLILFHKHLIAGFGERCKHCQANKIRHAPHSPVIRLPIQKWKNKSLVTTIERKRSNGNHRINIAFYYVFVICFTGLHGYKLKLLFAAAAVKSSKSVNVPIIFIYIPEGYQQELLFFFSLPPTCSLVKRWKMHTNAHLKAAFKSNFLSRWHQFKARGRGGEFEQCNLPQVGKFSYLSAKFTECRRKGPEHLLYLQQIRWDLYVRPCADEAERFPVLHVGRQRWRPALPVSRKAGDGGEGFPGVPVRRGAHLWVQEIIPSRALGLLPGTPSKAHGFDVTRGPHRRQLLVRTRDQLQNRERDLGFGQVPFLYV